MRDRPVRFSESTGLRLCGIADEPFCPSEKNSSASSTSVRCMWRISTAKRSTEAAITPSVEKYIAWRSRGMTCVEVGKQQVGGAGELDVEAGVEHVGGGHALMHEARLGADDLGKMGEEGDDVVLGLALDLVDAGDVENGVLGLGPDRLGGLLGDRP